MNLTQHTDQQLIDRLNFYGEEILATSDSDHFYSYLCSKFDAIQAELDSRGLW